MVEVPLVAELALVDVDAGPTVRQTALTLLQTIQEVALLAFQTGFAVRTSPAKW